MFHRVFIAIAVVLLVVWLVIDTSKNPEQFISFGGICMFVVLIFIFSANRRAVSCTWSRHVLCGMITDYKTGVNKATKPVSYLPVNSGLTW